MAGKRKYNGWYRGEALNRVAFPMGGIGAGMICLEGTGALSHFSVRNRPEVFNEPYLFSAVCVKGERNVARVLERQVPLSRVFGFSGAGNGGGDRTYGFPRFRQGAFRARFPFATARLSDPDVPLTVEVTGWSPFVAGDADRSSLPVCALEYRFGNPGSRPVEAVYSFHARNVMAVGKDGQSVTAAERGFVLRQAASAERPWERGELCVMTDAEDAAVNCAWFRGGWFDPQTMAWRDVAEGRLVSRPPVTEGAPSPGASLFVPLKLEPGAKRTVVLMLCWYVPESELRCGPDLETAEPAVAPRRHRPWYAGAFADIESVAAHWRRHYRALRRESRRFSRCFQDSTLAPEVVEAVGANLTILKSPTALRQTDGRLWCWEGCCDAAGCCDGSCTHVWNYAQAVPHLFPALERTLRETEFGVSQDERGHQAFRSGLPIRPIAHRMPAAADGQLGGIMKAYREWRISGDIEWLRGLWPSIRASLAYCIETWDPDRTGVPVEPHHNTYDIEFWGPDGMCGSFYVGALFAAARMAEALGEDADEYRRLYEKGKTRLEDELFDGEYFIQKIQWKGLRAGDPTKFEALAGSRWSPEAVALAREEGPKYQYGSGCLSDGVLGAWLARMCGLGEVLDPDKVESHLLAVYRHNFKPDLSAHANPQRPTYAVGPEGGLLACTWPKGGALSLPFPYSNEVWTGIEYQAAGHLILTGHIEEGLQIVRTARDRYDGRYRNPFNEYECGHWYARAMSSFGLLQALTGARYDAVEKVLYLAPAIEGDFRSFLCTATGYGTVGVKDGKPFLEVKSGRIEIARIDYTPFERR